MACQKVKPGQRYGKWLVVEGNTRRSYDNMLLHKCRCECGNEAYLPGTRLLKNLSTMCLECARKLPMAPGMKTLVDLTGRVFGKWTVLHRALDTRGTSASWCCVCECGREAVRVGSSLVNQKTTMCVVCAGARRSGSANHQWKGYEEISSRYITRCKRQAASRGLAYEVSVEYLWSLFLKQDRKCALSGVEIKFGRSDVAGNHTASLDRIDPSVGYVQSNVQWIHYKLNHMKMDMQQLEFIEWAAKVANHSASFRA